MKQPIETLMTELAVLEDRLERTFKEYEEAENTFASSVQKNIIKRVDIVNEIATIKTQIAQANENS